MSVVTGVYKFAFCITYVTFACLEVGITQSKYSKIITLIEHTSMTVKDIATTVGVGKSRILRTFQNSVSLSPIKGGGSGHKREKTTPRTDTILIRNSKTKKDKHRPLRGFIRL